MNPFINEEVAWMRLKDIQREMENSRLMANAGIPAMWRQLTQLAQGIWWNAGLAMRRRLTSTRPQQRY